LTEKGFEKAKQIRYDGYTITDCSKTTSNAFSLPCFNFFYDCKEDFIKNIWISTSLITSTDHFNKISETLYELGEGCELVLINWNSSELIDSSSQDDTNITSLSDFRAYELPQKHNLSAAMEMSFGIWMECITGSEHLV
jgi:hypothetical protein